MTEKEPSTQETILLATIDCINENGLEHLTTRMIAEKADANIASINYYFRTKDILVNQALEITIKHMLEDVNETISDKSRGFREILNDVIYYLISGASNNMGISQAHLYRLVIDKDYDSVSAVSFLKAFMFMMLTPFFFQLKEEDQLNQESFQRQMAEHYTEMFYAMA
jgi:AcrR family transcriptional regulator